MAPALPFLVKSCRPFDMRSDNRQHSGYINKFFPVRIDSYDSSVLTERANY